MIPKVIAAALDHALDTLPVRALGLRSYALPTETHLGACISALEEVLAARRLDKTFVVIGTSIEGRNHPRFRILPSDQAAAEATRLRSEVPAPEGQPHLVYLNTNSNPGENGLDVLVDLTKADVARAFAERQKLPLLAELAQHRARAVRDRIMDAGIEDLGRYADIARQHGEPFATPLLGLLLDRSGAKRAGAAAQAFDALSGQRAAEGLDRAKKFLESLADQDRDAAGRVLARRFPSLGERDPFARLLALCGKTLAYSRNPTIDVATLCGLTAEIARTLRGGDAALHRILEGEEPGPDADKRHVGAETDAEVVQDGRAAVLRTSVRIEEHEDSWQVFVGSGPDEVELRPNGRAWMLEVIKDRVNAAGWRSGIAFFATGVDAAPSPARGVIKEFSKASDAQAVWPVSLTDVRSKFLRAREELVRGVLALTVKQGERPPGGHTEENYELTAWLVENFPLLVAAQLPREIDEHSKAFADLVSAVFGTHSVIDPRAKHWLINLDLLASIAGQDIRKAWLLPLHPFRLAHAALWLRDGEQPPPIPALLAVQYVEEKDLRPQAEDYEYTAVQQAFPTDRGLALAGDQAVEAVWGLLRPHGLETALAIELMDVRHPEAVVDGLCAAAQRLLDDDADVPGVHLDVSFSFSDPVFESQMRCALPSALSAEALSALRTAPGAGVSLTLAPAVTAAAAIPKHAIVQAVATPFVRLAAGAHGPASGGLELVYRPVDSGNIGAIEYRGLELIEGYNTLLRALDMPEEARGLAPVQLKPDVGGALVKTLVARGGWPISPTKSDTLYDRAEIDDHVVATLVDRDIFSRVVEPALRAVSRAASELDLAALRDGVVAMADCRALVRDIVEEGDVRHARGALGKVRAFGAARSAGAHPALVISLDTSEGRHWARTMGQLLGSDATRADLLILEGNDDRTQIIAIRVAELKSGNYRAKNDVKGLARQAQIAAARVRYCFAGGDAAEARAGREALRRLVWLGAGAQLEAKRWEAALRGLDAALQFGSPPPIMTECWIVPEESWDGPKSFALEPPRYNPDGSTDGGVENVAFRVLDPTAVDQGVVEQQPSVENPRPTEPAASDVASSAAPHPRAIGAQATATQETSPHRNAEARSSEPGHASREVRPDVAAMSEPKTLAGSTEPATGTPGGTQPAPMGADGIRIVLGKLASGDEAYWLPNRTDRVLHFNVGITGTMGTGKTQLTKSLLAQLVWGGAANVGGMPPGILVFDYKGDYVDKSHEPFATAIGARIHEPQLLPINPLRPVHPNSMLDFALTPQVFADTLRAIDPRMGGNQRNDVVNAVNECYRAYGIDEADPRTWTKSYPTLKDLRDHLVAHDLAAGAPLNTIDLLVKLRIFAEEDPGVDFDAFLDGINVIMLEKLTGTPTVIRAILSFFMNAFHDRMKQLGEAALEERGGHTLRRLRRFVLVDEADDFIGLDLTSLKNVMQQGRSYGHGVILSTQYLHHFNKTDTPLRPLIGTWVLHQMRDLSPADVKALFALPDKATVNAYVTRLGRLPQHTSLCVGLSNPEYEHADVEVKDIPFKHLPRPG